MGKVIDFVKAYEQRKELREMDEELAKDPDLFFAYKFGFDVAFDITIALHEMGYNIGEDAKCIVDILAIEESVRALIMRCAKKEYPMQKISEGIFRNEEGDELDYETIMKEFLSELEDNV